MFSPRASGAGESGGGLNNTKLELALLPFQKDGVAAVKKSGGKLLIGDEMGERSPRTSDRKRRGTRGNSSPHSARRLPTAKSTIYQQSTW